jgi:hypothetical protein
MKFRKFTLCCIIEVTKQLKNIALFLSLKEVMVLSDKFCIFVAWQLDLEIYILRVIPLSKYGTDRS